MDNEEINFEEWEDVEGGDVEDELDVEPEEEDDDEEDNEEDDDGYFL
jgi:hypothetical protein